MSYSTTLQAEAQKTRFLRIFCKGLSSDTLIVKTGLCFWDSRNQMSDFCGHCMVMKPMGSGETGSSAQLWVLPGPVASSGMISHLS